MPDETPEQWGARTRCEQGLPEYVKDPAVLDELAHAVPEFEATSEKINDDSAAEKVPATTVVRRLPGRARPRKDVLRECQEYVATMRRNLARNNADALWPLYAPDLDRLYRWRIQLDCGCIQETMISGDQKLPTDQTYDCDHLHHSRLQPGQIYCDNDACDRPQPYREIVDWEQRREVTLPPDPDEPPEWWAADQATWTKTRHAAPHTSAFWRVTLSCGHRTEVCTDVDWKPEDGPCRVNPQRLQEMTAEMEEYWAAHPDEATDREAEHHRRMLAQGWPSPEPETLCFVYSQVRQIVACERVGWLGPRTKPSSPKQPSKASLQRRLREAEEQAAQLREQLAQLEKEGDR